MIEKPFVAIETMEKFRTMKIASSDSNNSYTFYGSTEMPIYGEPEIMWNQICFIEDVGSIYARGRLYANLDEVLSKYDEVNTKVNDISNKLNSFDWWIEQ